jgi:hypothetical protein
MLELHCKASWARLPHVVVITFVYDMSKKHLKKYGQPFRSAVRTMLPVHILGSPIKAPISVLSNGQFPCSGITDRILFCGTLVNLHSAEVSACHIPNSNATTPC